MAKANPSKILDETNPVHQSALNILPVLVRQAKAGMTIFYKDLADELGIRNPRNLGKPLDSIYAGLDALGNAWGEEIPNIQSLVIKTDTGLPGWRTRIFRDAEKSSNKEKKALFRKELVDIYAYPKWDAVLHGFGLQPAPVDKKFADMAKNPPPPPATKGGRGGGESPEHKALKLFIGDNPSSVKIKLGSSYDAETERKLPSGDSLDVSFEDKSSWIGVEVKSLSKSNNDDIMRGLYQCVKYWAVMQASLTVQEVEKNVRVILALDGKLPPALKPLRNTLGIEVVEDIAVK